MISGWYLLLVAAGFFVAGIGVGLLLAPWADRYQDSDRS